MGEVVLAVVVGARARARAVSGGWRRDGDDDGPLGHMVTRLFVRRQPEDQRT